MCLLRLLTDESLPCPHSGSLLLLQQPVGRQNLHHYVWSHQHVLLSCHGRSAAPFSSERFRKLWMWFDVHSLPSQVRLMLVLAPVMCILSGIGVSQVLTTYMKNLDVSRPDKKSKKQQDSTYPIKNEVGGVTGLRQPGTRHLDKLVVLVDVSHKTVPRCVFLPGCQRDDPGHGLLPHHIHLPLHLGDQRGLLLPLHRAVGPRRRRQPHHLRRLQRGLLLAAPQHPRGQPPPPRPARTSVATFSLSPDTSLPSFQDAKVMSWWDYGYQITAMANRTILVDNNTWNNTHISRVGQVSCITDRE